MNVVAVIGKNSTDCPRARLRRSPLAELLARRAASSWNCSRRRSSSGVRRAQAWVGFPHRSVHRPCLAVAPGPGEGYTLTAAAISGHVPENLSDNVVGRDGLGFSFEVEDEAMAQTGGGDGLDVAKLTLKRPCVRARDLTGQQKSLPPRGLLAKRRYWLAIGAAVSGLRNAWRRIAGPA